MTTAFEFDDMISGYLETPVPNAKPESALIVGSFGQGKTYMAATAIDLPGVKKGLYIDTEGSTVGVVKDPKWSIIRVDKYPSPERLQAIATARKISVDEVDIEEERFRFLDQLLSSGPRGLFHPNSKTDFDVIVIDAVDVAQRFAKYHFMYGDGIEYSDRGAVDSFKGWDHLGSWLRRIAEGMRRHPAFGVFVAHESEKQAKSGAIVPTVALQGALKEELPGLVDMVMRIERTLEEGDDGNDVKVTYGTFLSADKDPAKDRFDFPPVVKNPSFPALFKYIDDNAEVQSEKKAKK